MKGVYQRKSDDLWVGTISAGKDAYGKRIRHTVYGKTEKEARTKLNNLRFEIDNGLHIDKNKDTLVGFLNTYIELNSYRWEETTISLYKMYVRVHFTPYFTTKRLDSVNPVDIDRFYASKLEKLAGNTVHKLHAFLKAAYAYGVKKDIVRVNICDKVNVPDTAEYRANIYDDAQFLELWNYVRNKYDRVPIALSAGCGLRRGEVFGLTWNDIDFTNGTITINKARVRFDKTLEKSTKNKTSTRTIHAPAYVIDTLRGYMKEQKVINLNGYILEITPGYYSQRFKWLLNKFNMPSIRFHDLRHYNATVMMNSGVPDKVAAERLGHSDTKMLHKVYQHVQLSADKEASNKIDRTFDMKKAK